MGNTQDTDLIQGADVMPDNANQNNIFSANSHLSASNLTYINNLYRSNNKNVTMCSQSKQTYVTVYLLQTDVEMK